jgi:multidrug efflux pump subunit AcrB
MVLTQQAPISEPNTETDEATSEAPAFTEAQIKMLNQVVNSAFSARSKSSEKKLEETLSSFAAKFEALAPKQEVQADKPAKIDPMVLQLKKELEHERSIRLEAENKNKEVSLRATLKDKLTALNVNPAQIKAVMATMIHEDKAVAYNDEGSLVFRSGDQEFDLDSGLKEWSKTSEAKSFIAPKGAAGSGQLVTSNNKSQTKTEISNEAAAIALFGSI